jgi:5-methylcytosine-specific restriction protein A
MQAGNETSHAGEEESGVSPFAPKHPCSYPGCATLTHAGRCDLHRRQERREYDRGRKDDPFHLLYAGRQWRRVREAKLAIDPLCERCRAGGRIEAATEVHHRTAVRDGGDPFDITGLESLCKPCHSRESAESGQRWG